MSWSPPPHIAPWPSIPRWMLTVPTSPTTGSLPIARAYRSASLGSIRDAGPLAQGGGRAGPRLGRHDQVRVREGAGPDRRMRLRGRGRAGADGRMLVPRALRDQRPQVGPV